MYRLTNVPEPAPEYPSPTVRPGWSLGEPPEPNARPMAHFVGPGDGWDLYWSVPDDARDEYCTDDDGNIAQIDWPYGDDDWADMDDLRALGFQCAL